MEDEESWYGKLKDAKRLTDVVTLCMEICAKNGPRPLPIPDSRVANTLQDLLWAEDVSHTHRKYIAKACFSLSTLAGDYNTMIQKKASARGAEQVELTEEDESIVLYGMMHSAFLKRLDGHVELEHVPDQLKRLFRAQSTGYTRWLHTAAECMLMTLEQPESLPGWWSIPYNHIWQVTLVNLESPYRGVREMMLRLVKELVHRREFATGTVLVEVERLHWLDRNKYHLLALLLREHPCKEDVAAKRAFHLGELQPALQQSLRYKHLVSGGQALLRAFASEEVSGWLAVSVRLWDIELLHSMAKYWFTNVTPKCFSNVFNRLLLHQLPTDENQLPAYLNSDKHGKLFLLTNLFKREFHKEHAHLEQLLLMLCRLADSEKPLPACRCLVQKSNDSTTDKLVPFLYGMYERYLRLSEHPKPLHPYQQTITAVRLFQLLVDQCFEFPSAHRYQLTARPLTQCGPWLEQLPSTIGSDPANRLAAFRNEISSLNYLLRSKYDDVCFAVAGMLFNQPRTYSLDGGLLALLANIHAQTSADLYPAMLVEVEQLVRQGIEGIEQDLYARATLAESHDQLHHAIDGATQVCFGIPELLLEAGVETIEPFQSLARTVASVVFKVLSLLNNVRPIVSQVTSDAILSAGTSFRIMECSMQRLLDNSIEWKSRKSPADSVQIALAKRAMQAELWKALRAVAIFTEKYALWLLDHYDQHPEEYDEELVCCIERFKYILRNCCHRGAIESSAGCLRRVVQRIMRDKAQRSSRLVSGAAPAEQTIGPVVRHVEQLFRDTLAVKPDDPRDFRRARGYLFLLQSIMQAEAEAGVEANSLLYHYLERHVMLSRRAALETMGTIGVLELHELNLLVKTASMKEAMLPYIDQLLVVALEALRYPDWPVRNAALQLYTSCTTKLSGQQQECVDPNCDWQPVYVALEEVMCKLPLTVAYIHRELQGATTARAADRTLPRCSPSFLLLLLEFLARFEYRGYGGQDDAWSTTTVESFRSFVWELLSHENDSVRRQAARCYAQLLCFQLQPGDTLFLANVGRLLRALFADAPCPNRQHGLCLAVYSYVRRYVTLRHFTDTREKREQHTLPAIRSLVAEHAPPEQGPPASYRYRTTLLEFLTYIGFKHTDPLLFKLLQPDAPAPADDGRETFLTVWERLRTDGELPSSSTLMPYELELELDHEPEPDD
ncbi:AGAP000676-PA-like protein [Anopheles sinensis]|uniref:AGAP000676-PA-like protein n=1 Tax=Anopheles sinensis TaxID=74873 RepID=A0A084VAC8_ANOSI|nr:AGAP000676-PA-like protein [Anopheles sinensis]